MFSLFFRMNIIWTCASPNNKNLGCVPTFDASPHEWKVQRTFPPNSMTISIEISIHVPLQKCCKKWDKRLLEHLLLFNNICWCCKQQFCNYTIENFCAIKGLGKHQFLVPLNSIVFISLIIVLELFLSIAYYVRKKQ